jgi:lipopolysaccharide cholinephosphotransferase
MFEDMELRKLQLIELKILLELKHICEKNNIKYFLMGGTLLGAVRHHGFIPWDDDIDVGMIRSEYSKFITICESELSEQYFLQTFETDKTYVNSFAKIRLNGTKYLEPNSSDELHHQGIFIDIFPFDKIPSKFLSKKIHILKLLAYTRMGMITHGYRIPKSTTLKEKIFNLSIQYISKVFSKPKIILLRENLFQKFNKKDTDQYINSSLYCYPIEIFDHFSELEFEGIKLPVPAGYVKYLECAYGDFMRLPPENKRISHTPHKPEFGKYSDINSVDDVLKQISSTKKDGDAICKQ